MAQLVERMVRAARLDPRLYAEVEADREARGQAVRVVLLTSLAAGIGSYTYAGVSGLILETLAALFGWYVWLSLTYVIGAKIFPAPQTCTSHGALRRALAFASVPGLLRVFGVVPGLTGTAFLLAAIWMLIAAIVAVRQALDYTSTARACGVCMLGWLAHVVLLLPVFLLYGQAPEA
jgi:hypothetical protein